MSLGKRGSDSDDSGDAYSVGGAHIEVTHMMAGMHTCDANKKHGAIEPVHRGCLMSDK